MPARRLFFLLATTTLLLVAALGLELLAWVALACDLALLIAFLLDLRRARAVALRAERQWPPMLAQGSAADVEVRVWRQGGQRARRGLPPLRLRLREGLAPALADAPRRHDLVLPAGAPRAVRWVYSLTPRRRGEAVAAPLTARVLGPWGLAWSQRSLLPPETVRVYPRIRWEGRVGHLLTLARRQQLGSMPTAWLGAGTEPYALREYRSGDPLAKIHWKATARHGHPIIREETWERGARLLILLDTARTMTARRDERSKLDHALAAALALARVAVGRGDRVTVLAFSHQVERVVRVGSGSRGMARAYQALYDLEARFVEPAYDLAAARAFELESRSATVVLLTSVVDLAAAELLREAMLTLERRHRPLLVNLLDAELAALAAEPPATVEDAFAQAAALEILLANRRLGKTLRRAGVRVVETPADRLALETLEAYLALFRTRLRRRAGRVA